MSGEDSEPIVPALQELLAGEHAALYAYSVLGAWLDPGGPEADSAVRAYDVHRTRRDTVARRLRDLGQQPAVAEPGYALPQPVRDVTSAATLARQTEERCAVLYASLVAAAPASSPDRSLGSTGLVDAATRMLGWGAPPTAFPGISRP